MYTIGSAGVGASFYNIHNQWTLAPVTTRSVTIGAGGQQSFLLTESGELYGLGCNGYGQLGMGDELHCGNWQLLTPSLTLSVVTGEYNSLLLTENGEVYAAGTILAEVSGDFIPPKTWRRVVV